MTPFEFQRLHEPIWRELELAAGLRRRDVGDAAPDAAGTAEKDRARFAALYRATCEHLELARVRAYPVHLVERLEALTAACHQRIYRQSDLGLARLGRFFLVDFPGTVRAEWRAVLLAAIVFVVPMLAVGVASYLDPAFILSIHDAPSVDRYDRMYGDGSGGRRPQDSDWAMFGHYVRNNIGIAFQCFASGLFLGIGSLFYLAFNGVLAGSIAGYLTWRGLGPNFYSFVVTHAAFELTAIVLAGAAGLMLGRALLAPGRQSRRAALASTARKAVVIVYGVAAMLLVAAVIEAFWSGAAWIEPQVKYAVGATCWIGVLAYLVFFGRPRRR
jgi:uncharacterized membrane protein SpoIIM required for sporulation